MVYVAYIIVPLTIFNIILLPGLGDRLMATLSSKVGSEWETIATYLGFRRDEIDRMKQDHPKAEERNFDMLVRWRRKHFSNIPILRGQLVDAFEKSGRRDLADYLEKIHGK